MPESDIQWTAKTEEICPIIKNNEDESSRVDRCENEKNKLHKAVDQTIRCSAEVHNWRKKSSSEKLASGIEITDAVVIEKCWAFWCKL